MAVEEFEGISKFPEPKSEGTLIILLSVLVLLNDLVWNFSKNLYETYRMRGKMKALTSYRAISSKRPGLNFFSENLY